MRRHRISCEHEIRARRYVNRVALAMGTAHTRVILLCFLGALGRMTGLIAAARAFQLETNLGLCSLLLVHDLAVCLKRMPIGSILERE